MSNKELRQHKKSDKIKWVITGVAFVLAFVMIAGICMQLFGKGKIQPTNWFNKTEQTTPVTSGTNGGGAVVSEGETHGISLMSARIAAEDYEDYGIAPQAENATILTAMFTPISTSNKNVTWTVTGGNGKVTVNPVSGNQLQATVTVSGSFSERATVKCTSSVNSEISATATVEYLCGISTLGNLQTCDSINDDFYLYSDNMLGTGSIIPTSIDYTLYFDFESSLKHYLQSKGWQITTYTEEITGARLVRGGSLGDWTGYDFISDLVTNGSADAVMEDIAEYFYGKSNQLVFEAGLNNVTFYYNGKAYDQQFDENILETSFFVKSFSDIEIPARNLNLNNSTLIFGPNGIFQ